MSFKETRELHDLLFTFMGLMHKKILVRFRQEYDGLPWMKKNHFKIMSILFQHRHFTATEIGKNLDLEKGSVTSLIDQLEEKGMVLRHEDASDRRKSLISLSAGGREEMHKIMDSNTRKLDDYLAAFDPGELKQFISSLRYVVTFMKDM